MSVQGPRITFGMIVFNGMPFLPFNLRSIYPFAHQIVVVEGASLGAATIADPDGHSSDGTLAELRRFAREEDPQGKILVVTAEDDGHVNGFWSGEKDEQSQAYASRATGEYLWQVDVDEFYMPDDIQTIVEQLASDLRITAVTFPTLTVWGGLHCVVDGWYLRRGAKYHHRLFKWGPGYTYARHRPPTVVDAQGRDTRAIFWLDGKMTASMGVIMYHYSLLFPKQVREKMEYYTNWGLYGAWYVQALRWLADSYLTLRHPYRVHNEYHYPSWLQRFDGRHPPEVERMMAAIACGSIVVEQRPMADTERLLESRLYAAGRVILQVGEPLERYGQHVRGRLAAIVRSVLGSRRSPDDCS